MMRRPYLFLLCISLAWTLACAAPAPLSPVDPLAGAGLERRARAASAAAAETTIAAARQRVTTTITAAVRVTTTTAARVVATPARATSVAAARDTTTSARAAVAASVVSSSSPSPSAGRSKTLSPTQGYSSSSSSTSASAATTSGASTATRHAGLFDSSSKSFPWVIIATVAISLFLFLTSIWLIKRCCHRRRFADPRDYSEDFQPRAHSSFTNLLNRSSSIESRESGSGSTLVDEYDYDEKKLDDEEDDKPLGMIRAQGLEMAKTVQPHVGWAPLPTSNEPAPRAALYPQPRRASLYAAPVRPEPTMNLSTRALQEQARRASTSFILPSVAIPRVGAAPIDPVASTRSCTPPPSYRSASAPPSMIQAQRSMFATPQPPAMPQPIARPQTTPVPARSGGPTNPVVVAGLPGVTLLHKPAVGSGLRYALGEGPKSNEGHGQ